MKDENKKYQIIGWIFLLVLIIILFWLFTSCSSSKDFWSRKYPRETHKSYKEKQHLMILQNTYLGRNKYFYSSHNTKLRTHKLHRK